MYVDVHSFRLSGPFLLSTHVLRGFGFCFIYAIYWAFARDFKFEMMFSAADCDSALIPADCKAKFFIQVLTISEAVSLTEFVKSVPAWYLLFASVIKHAFIFAAAEEEVVVAELPLNPAISEQAPKSNKLAIKTDFFIFFPFMINV